MNNREKAALIWLAVALTAGLTKPDIRSALLGVVKAFGRPIIIGPLLVLAGWTVGLASIAHTFGLWRVDVRNDTIAWFLTVGFGLFFSLEQVREAGYFRRWARRALALTAFVEGFANLEAFSLPAELVFVPVLAVLGGMLAISESKEEYAPVRRLLNGLLSLTGVCLLVYVVVRLATDFNAGHALRAMALPIWLTLGSLPFVYAFGLRAEYEQAFLRIDFRTRDPVQRRRAKRALFRTAKMRASDVAGFAGHWIEDLTSARSDDDAWVIAKRWRKTWRSERRAELMSSAQGLMREWLTEDDPTFAEIHADTLRHCWEGLDREQRAALKADGLHLARKFARADAVHSLPD